MRKIIQWGSAVLAILFFHQGFAAGSDETAIRDSLKQHLPKVIIDNISTTPIQGVYQVSAGANVLYMSKDGRYALSGDMIDLADGRSNITENARKKARVAAIKALGESNMVVFSPKDPKYTVIVFTDVDCSYCRKLQADMEAINAKGIAIRYLAFPRSGPNTPGFDKMVRVWCSKDKNKALSLASLDKSFEGKDCSKDTVMREFELGLKLGINGTPTLIFEDGTLVPGYMTPDQLLETAKQIREQSSSFSA
jgi:thiol:disulfide interchange protein DsbC